MSIEDPVTRQRITVLENSLELYRMDFEMFPGGFVPTLHIHPSQEERFEVTSGRPEFEANKRIWQAEPGEVVVVPPGTPHVFRNPTDEDARLIIELRPALRSAEMFEVLYRMGREGKLAKNGLPRNPIRAAMFAREFRPETQAATPILRFATALAAPVAAFGRLVGFKI